MHGLHVDAKPLAHPGRDTQRPRSMHLRTEGGVNRHAPVAELITEPLDHDVAVIGDMPGGLALLVDIGEQVVRGPGVEARCGHTGSRLVGTERADLTDELAHGTPQLDRAAQGVALPERQLAGLAGRRSDEDLVVGDVLDPPGRGAEGEHIADPRLVDHLLVELADASPRALARGEEHGIQAPVRDGSPAGDGEPLRSGTAGERARDSVPDESRSQLGELVTRVTPGQHVEDRLQDGPGECGEGSGLAYQRLQVINGPVVHRAHGDDVLSQNVDRVGRHAQRLDRPGAHPVDHHSGLDEVAAELGEEHSARHRAHLVPGPPDALQPAGNTRRGLHLDDEIDGAHVDAELERAGGDHRGETTGLEVLLDQGALLLADRAVVCAGEHPRSASRRSSLRHSPASGRYPHLGGCPGARLDGDN